MLLFLKSTLKNYSILFDPTIETGIWSRDTLAYRMLIVHVKGTNNIFYIKKRVLTRFKEIVFQIFDYKYVYVCVYSEYDPLSSKW